MSGMHGGSYGTIVHELDPETGLQRKHRTAPPSGLTALGHADFWRQLHWHMHEHYIWEIEFRGGEYGQDDREIYWPEGAAAWMEHRWWEPPRGNT